MINRKKKGQRLENMCANFLKSQGWAIVFKSQTIKTGPVFRGNDFADLFDIVAVHGHTWKFISVKSKSQRGNWKGHQLEIKKWIEDHAIGAYENFNFKPLDRSFVSYELWIYEKGHWDHRCAPYKFVGSCWNIIKL